MKQAFVHKNFHALSYAMINQANSIIDEYRSLGFSLTLRQLYYQFVARDLFYRRYSLKNNRWVRDENGTINAQPNYDNLGQLINDARLAGLVDWDAIEDRTRYLRGHLIYADPADAIAETRRCYRIDMWAGQPKAVEVWIEKDALIGVIERVCLRWDVDFFACRGYASQSEMYVAGQRIRARKIEQNQDTVVLHLGDHDPSGCDMTRDNEERLSMFAGFQVPVHRIALNMDQIEEFDPPPNPAKITDSRANAYIEQYGDESWELDALEPRVIGRLIEENVKRNLNMELFKKRTEQFNLDREVLSSAVDFVDNPEAWKKIEN
jgi:hypothetical protein